MNDQFTHIVNLAKKEHWDEVDELLGEHRNDTDYLAFARTSLANFGPQSDMVAADIGASIFEITDPENITDADTVLLQSVIAADVRIKGNYAVFRAACALARHTPGRAPDEVIALLHVFSFDPDPDVAHTAKEYLQ